MRKLEATTALSLFAPSTKETNNLIVEGVIKRTLNQKTLSADHVGVQTDGDLWEQAWLAILKRGAANQTLRKVKGHATQEDIEAGRSTPEDKKGQRQ